MSLSKMLHTIATTTSGVRRSGNNLIYRGYTLRPVAFKRKRPCLWHLTDSRGRLVEKHETTGVNVDRLLSVGDASLIR